MYMVYFSWYIGSGWADLDEYTRDWNIFELRDLVNGEKERESSTSNGVKTQSISVFDSLNNKKLNRKGWW